MTPVIHPQEDFEIVEDSLISAVCSGKRRPGRRGSATSSEKNKINKFK